MASSFAIRSSTYPGKPAQFELDGKLEDWNTDYEDDDSVIVMIRSLKFKSITPDPSIEEFNLLGYKDGSIGIYAQINKIVAKEFSDYLKSLGYEDELFSVYNSYTVAHSLANVKILFNILSKENEILDRDALEKVKKVVEKGSFTPFKGVVKNIAYDSAEEDMIRP